jgi:predicted GNAT superfamily acetyltransferase
LQNCSKNSNRKRVGDRVIARWTNNKYYAGEITNISEEDQSIDILFDDGYKITHALHDVTAVLADKVPDSVEYKDHVIASWQGSYRQYIGYVIQVSESRGFKVHFDDNGEAWYKKEQLRILPDASSPHDGK